MSMDFDDAPRGARGKAGADRGDRKGAAAAGGAGMRKRVCRFCADKTLTIDYKDSQLLKYFITDRGKIIPRRISGNCAKHQRKVALAVRRSRMIALMPYTVTGQ
jgi:small subunit ribosomal protein S18